MGAAGLNVPVTPAGIPSRARVTSPAKLVRAMVTVAGPDAPAATLSVVGVTVRAIAGMAVTVRGKVVVASVTPEPLARIVRV